MQVLEILSDVLHGVIFKYSIVSKNETEFPLARKEDLRCLRDKNYSRLPLARIRVWTRLRDAFLRSQYVHLSWLSRSQQKLSIKELRASYNLAYIARTI